MSENDYNSDGDQRTYETPVTTTEETGTTSGPELAGRGVRSYPRTWGLPIRTEF